MNQEETLRRWARGAIQATGLRVTSARIATLTALRKAAVPQTHAEVVELLAGWEIDKATVFRNLSDLVAAGLIRRTELGDHAWRFEVIGGESGGHAAHPHFVCTDCGSISCMEDVELTPKSRQQTERYGSVTEILVRGRCCDCV